MALLFTLLVAVKVPDLFIRNKYQSSLGLNHQQRVHMVGLVAPAAHVAGDGLLGHQWEERPLVL